MSEKLVIYNTLTRKKEEFKPINPPFVGLYVCGPTVYGEPHLGHVRMAITFDLLYRYLKHIGYKVRYVRNVTDVGHLEDEVAGEGQDRISKRAKIEQLEPMEVVQKYKNIFNDIFNKLNLIPPGIEPLASGHIIEQQQMIKKIIDNGYAYENNGSVYFDINEYSKKYNYGKLSGRKLEDLLSNTRELEGQSEKRNPLDFALWKKATDEHLMYWPSEWSNGFPGWHLECSVMGTKYLGETFDIHGGGLDLLFPHHECEIAQSVAAQGKEHVKYWMHNNMITIDGQKMAKSLNNFITLNELFTGEHPKLENAYSPMTVRFFILQAQYRSTLDFSNEALQASEKGLVRFFAGMETLKNLNVTDKSSFDIHDLERKAYNAMNDDINSPVLIAHLFDGVKYINSVKAGTETISKADKEKLISLYKIFVEDILGLKQEEKSGSNDKLLSFLINMLLDNRMEAKKNKDFKTADKIRSQLTELGVIIKDTKDGYEWEIK